MNYYTLWADYHSTGLRNENNFPLKAKPAELTEDCWQAIQQWVRDYAPITLAGEGVTRANVTKVRELDLRGLALAERIEREVGNTKVEYISEGLVRRISGENDLEIQLKRKASCAVRRSVGSEGVEP